MKYRAHGNLKTANKSIKYEIGCRFDSELPKREKRRGDVFCKKVTEAMMKGERLTRCLQYTPPAYIEKLANVAPRHTAKPSWTFFDFSGMITTLGAWLAAISWKKDASLGSFIDISKFEAHPISAIPDMNSLAEDCVFISQTVTGGRDSGAFWVLAAAARVCGAEVYTERVILATNNAPWVKDIGGTQLAADIVTSLSILAELYDQSGHGAAFAFCLAKGLHSVNSVVAHSDEGGLMRDILREMRCPRPYGGLPEHSPMSSGIAVLPESRRYSSLVRLVDSWSLLSAACFAQSIPMRTLAGGQVRPALVEGCPDFDPAVYDALSRKRSDGLTTDEDIAAMQNMREAHAAALENCFTNLEGDFLQGFIPCLSEVFGVAPGVGGTEDVTVWFGQMSRSVFEEPDNRHLLKNSVLSPFFWIEPTTILSSDCCGSEAERHGWGSWGCYPQKVEEKMFPRLRVTACRRDQCTLVMEFDGARKAKWISALRAAKGKPLEGARFSVVNADSLVMIGATSQGTDPRMALQNRCSILEYLWTRGQSSLPHPAEFVHTDNLVKLTFNTWNKSVDDYYSSFPEIDELQDCPLQLTFLPPGLSGYGASNVDNRRERFTRTTGHAALALVSSRVRTLAYHEPDEVEASRTIQPWELEGDHMSQKRTPPVQLEGTLPAVRASETVKGDEVAGRPDPIQPPNMQVGATMVPVYAAGTHTGPKVTMQVRTEAPRHESSNPGGDTTDGGARDGAGAVGVSPGPSS
ncbi:capsid protein [Eimeriavirus sani]|uniref:Capsid protein n=1 Tax=Eimeria stiedai RNA virus 1 TaxID=1898175 RepID=A0A6G7PRV1_9VIRU|nr:capsid protein [Eimeria stiedai RNA virus 1]